MANTRKNQDNIGYPALEEIEDTVLQEYCDDVPEPDNSSSDLITLVSQFDNFLLRTSSISVQQEGTAIMLESTKQHNELNELAKAIAIAIADNQDTQLNDDSVAAVNRNKIQRLIESCLKIKFGIAGWPQQENNCTIPTSVLKDKSSEIVACIKRKLKHGSGFAAYIGHYGLLREEGLINKIRSALTNSLPGSPRLYAPILLESDKPELLRIIDETIKEVVHLALYDRRGSSLSAAAAAGVDHTAATTITRSSNSQSSMPMPANYTSLSNNSSTLFSQKLLDPKVIAYITAVALLLFLAPRAHRMLLKH